MRCHKHNLAFSRRIAPELCQKFLALINSEGAGNAGCALHPRSRTQNCGKLRVRAYRAAEAIRHSLRNGFTAYNELSPENGSFASVAPREAVASGCIDASTATSGPHVFAVRKSRARLSQLPRPPHPRPTFVTIASAPLVGTGCMRCSTVRTSGKAKYFLFWDLTPISVNRN